MLGMTTYGTIPNLAVLGWSIFLFEAARSGLAADVHLTIDAYIDWGRNRIVQDALDKGCTHLMFLDQDVSPPSDTLERLLLHDLPIVGGVYYGKEPGSPPVCGVFEPEFTRLIEVKPHLMELGWTGMGCTLIKCDVFREMEAHYGDKKWYSTAENAGEDIWFCRRAQELGIPVFVDGSLVVGHVGQRIFTHKDYNRETLLRQGS